MASSFTTFNQFDKRFSEFEKFGGDRTACPLFGLLTCYHFMMTGDISQKQHENNIYASVTNYMTVDIPKYISFEDLLIYTNNSLQANDVNVTTPELITGGVISYEHIFRFGQGQNYCVLFLKNRNFIAVLYKVDGSNETYSVRDCHENTQRNFDNFTDLQTFLNNTYQFEQMTIVDGVHIPEYSNIEFMTIEQPFELVVIDPDLFDETLEEDKTFEAEVTIGVADPSSSDPSVPQNIPIDYSQFAAYSANFVEGDGAGEDYVNFL